MNKTQIQGTAKRSNPPVKGHTVRILYPAICIAWAVLYIASLDFLTHLATFILSAAMIVFAVLAIKGPKDKERLFHILYTVALVLNVVIVCCLQLFLSPYTFTVPIGIVGAVMGLVYPYTYARWEAKQNAAPVEEAPAEEATEEAPAEEATEETPAEEAAEEATEEATAEATEEAPAEEAAEEAPAEAAEEAPAEEAAEETPAEEPKTEEAPTEE